MAVAQREVLEELRERIRRIERRPARTVGGVETGWPSIDAMLPQGFPRGAISELIGCAGSGKTTVAASAVARATACGGLAAWIDGRGELYAPAVQSYGIDLQRLLIVRPGDVPSPSSAAAPSRTVPAGGRQALWAAEAVLGSGAFAAVVLDIPLAAGARFNNGSGAVSVEAMLRRLVTAAEKGGAIAVWLSEPGGGAPSARIRLEVWRDGDVVRARHAPRGLSTGAGGDAA